MKNKSPQRHSPEKIKRALARLASGKPLTDVAKELGVSKGLLSYWKNHSAQSNPTQEPTKLRIKSDKRSLAFIEHCWKSIGLAFGKLDLELKKEKPQGIRDLALTIAVLTDKMSQVTQNLRSNANPRSVAWTASEDTLMILRQHKEVKSIATPQEKIIETNLSVPGLEPQKRGVTADPTTSQSIGNSTETAQRGATGGN
jgi:hypothetical protein